MLMIILLVCFVVIMLRWGLILVGTAGGSNPDGGGWLAFAFYLIIGMVVFIWAWASQYPR